MIGTFEAILSTGCFDGVFTGFIVGAIRCEKGAVVIIKGVTLGVNTEGIPIEVGVAVGFLIV